jgi:hypothetical protein
MLREQDPVLLLNVVFEYASLTLDSAFVLLLMGRDACIIGYLHRGPPDVPE